MIRLLHPKDKREVLDLLELNLRRLIFIGVSKTDANLITTHLSYLRADSRELLVTARLESDPEAETTRLTVDYSFAPKQKEPAQ